MGIEEPVFFFLMLLINVFYENERIHFLESVNFFNAHSEEFSMGKAGLAFLMLIINDL